MFLGSQHVLENAPKGIFFKNTNFFFLYYQWGHLLLLEEFANGTFLFHLGERKKKVSIFEENSFGSIFQDML